MKKVVCIDNSNVENKLLGRFEYDVITEKGDYYLIRYNLHDEEWFYSERFETVDKLEDKSEDVVNNPRHYKGNKGIETIDFIEGVLTREEFIGYLRGNIIKYQSRANLKGRKEEDLKKAKWYSDKLVEVLKNER